jgi:hypothetical protein
MKGSSLDHAPGAASSLFDWNEDGSWSLRAAPSQQDTDYQDNPAPGLCNSCGDTSAKPDNRPPASPFVGQPPSGTYVPSLSLTPFELEVRISSLNDKDTEKVVNIYGGSTLKNKILVLTRIEQWISKNGRKLIQVVRNNGKKGGVAQVICSECQHSFISIQKVAEHITSFHWHLPIWSCRKAGWCVCRRVPSFGLALMLSLVPNRFGVNRNAIGMKNRHIASYHQSTLYYVA